MQSNKTLDAIRYAIYFVVTQNTVRGVANHFGVSKSHVHNILSEMNEQNFRHSANKRLARAVKDLLEKNKRERHIRGGNATKIKYMKKEESKQ